MSYFVYILRTSSNTLYTGQTNNLEKRLEEHHDKSSKSAKYVRYFDSVELVYSEKYPTREGAMRREWQLKKWSRKKKESLIRGAIVPSGVEGKRSNAKRDSTKELVSFPKGSSYPQQITSKKTVNTE